MGNVDNPEFHEIQRLCKKDPEKALFWVGAGISHAAPTCLPLGKELTTFTLEEICGKTVSNRIFHIWKKVTDIIKKQDRASVSEIPRLESILDVVRRSEEKLVSSSFSFLSGFRAFSNAPPNSIHFHLANSLLEGVTIITPNFDLCIEKAWQEIQCSPIFPVPRYGMDLVKFNLNKKMQLGQIWHYHGVAMDPVSIGATVKAIKAGFSKELKNHLIEKIKSCNVIVFIGYSFFDGFDVNPFFLSISKGFFDQTKAVYIQHNQGEQLTRVRASTRPSKLSPPDFERISRVLACFKEIEFYQGETCNLFNGENIHEIKIDPFIWKNAFLSEANLVDLAKIRPLLICSLSDYLGININLLKPKVLYTMMQNKSYYDTQYLLDQITISLRRQHLTLLEKKYHRAKKSRADQDDLLGYYYSKGNYEKAKEYAITLEQVEASIDSAQELNWVQFTSLASYCRPIIAYYLKNIFVRKIRLNDQATVNRLLGILIKLNSTPLQNILDVNQLGTSLRFQFLFHMLTNKGKIDHALIEKSIEIYAENTSIPGYISVFRDIAINYLLSAKLFGNKKYLRNSWKYAKTSFQISCAVGDMPGLFRAVSVLTLISIEALLSTLF